MMASNSPGLIVRIPKLSDPRKSLTLNVTIGDPVRTATSKNTIIVRVGQHRPPAEIDLYQSGAAYARRTRPPEDRWSGKNNGSYGYYTNFGWRGWFLSCREARWNGVGLGLGGKW